MYEWPWLLDQLPVLWTLPCLAVFGDRDTGDISNVRAYERGCVFAFMYHRLSPLCVRDCVYL